MFLGLFLFFTAATPQECGLKYLAKVVGYGNLKTRVQEYTRGGQKVLLIDENYYQSRGQWDRAMKAWTDKKVPAFFMTTIVPQSATVNTSWFYQTKLGKFYAKYKKFKWFLYALPAGVGLAVFELVPSLKEFQTLYWKSYGFFIGAGLTLNSLKQIFFATEEEWENKGDWMDNVESKLDSFDDFDAQDDEESAAPSFAPESVSLHSPDSLTRRERFLEVNGRAANRWLSLALIPVVLPLTMQIEGIFNSGIGDAGSQVWDFIQNHPTPFYIYGAAALLVPNLIHHIFGGEAVVSQLAKKRHEGHIHSLQHFVSTRVAAGPDLIMIVPHHLFSTVQEQMIKENWARTEPPQKPKKEKAAPQTSEQ